MRPAPWERPSGLTVSTQPRGKSSARSAFRTDFVALGLSGLPFKFVGRLQKLLLDPRECGSFGERANSLHPLAVLFGCRSCGHRPQFRPQPTTLSPLANPADDGDH